MRVSFGRNSAGVLEIVDANDYYPFGMNHLKTGNAFFGQGSFKNYKFLGNELQETGLYDMNARFYMPDLGRFGQHDPLSASTLDPYGYAYNNPMLFADPSGLEGDPVNGGGGSGGTVTPASFGDIPGGYNGAPTLITGAGINDVAAEQNIQGVVLNSKGKSSNSAEAMPTNCIACSVGSRVTPGIELSKPQPTPLPLNWDCGHCNDHGVVMMDSMWDVVGIAIANNVKPENQYAAMGVTLLAALITRSPSVAKAEVGIARAEASIAKVEVSSTTKALAPYYPVDGGALGKWTNITLEAGTKIDRFGSEFGQYFSPKGTPMAMRALPPGNSGVYNAYKVVKPFQIQTSKIAPAFGKMGTGTQYYSPFLRANELEAAGFIKKLP